MRPDIILAVDTSAAHCAAALLSGDRVCLRLEEMQKGQAERLMPMLQELMTESGVGWAELTALAVGTGPGNFTGVRIAVAAVRGLALGLGIKAIGVTRLEAMAYGASRPVTVIEDARRDEAYAQTFTAEGAEPARLIPANTAGLLAPDHIGPGGRAPVFPMAEAIARIGLERIGTPAPRPAPFYLRSADATAPSDPPLVLLP